MSITLIELLQNKYEYINIPSFAQVNLMILLEKMNKIRDAWGKPMIVTSGFRSMEDHLRIYKEKAKREGKKFDQSKVPMGSMHLKGAAVDISDPKGELAKWCRDNEKLLESIGLWCEDTNYTKGWVHLQTSPYGSYKPGKSMFFKP